MSHCWSWVCCSLIVYGCGFEPTSSSAVANTGEMTWKTDVWAKAKVVSGKTVREKQEASYLSDLLDRVKKFTTGRSAHTKLLQHKTLILDSFCKVYMGSYWFSSASTSWAKPTCFHGGCRTFCVIEWCMWGPSTSLSDLIQCNGLFESCTGFRNLIKNSWSSDISISQDKVFSQSYVLQLHWLHGNVMNTRLKLCFQRHFDLLFLLSLD